MNTLFPLCKKSNALWVLRLCVNPIKTSAWGEKIAGPSAIVDLMEDLGAALNNNPDLLFLGGGNPAQIPAVQAIFAQHWQAIGAQSAAVNKVCGVYQSPQGDEQLIAELQTLFRAQGLAVGAEHWRLSAAAKTRCFVI